MEQNTPKFRLRLNLFDGIVLLLILAAGALVLWSALKSQAPEVTAEAAPQSSATVRYTVRFQRLPQGTGQLIQPGDQLVDNVKNFEIGRVVSTETAPAETQAINQETRTRALTVVEGFEDVITVVEAPCTATEESITVGGGYVLRVGAMAYVRGQGYMVSGPIVAMELEGAQ